MNLLHRTKQRGSKAKQVFCELTLGRSLGLHFVVLVLLFGVFIGGGGLFVCLFFNTQQKEREHTNVYFTEGVGQKMWDSLHTLQPVTLGV